MSLSVDDFSADSVEGTLGDVAASEIAADKRGNTLMIESRRQP